jgi:two-component system cell cycle response regulator
MSPYASKYRVALLSQRTTAMTTAAIDASRPVAHPEALKVLIADDERDCRDALEDAVRCLGYDCTIARDGVEAWEMHEADRADVILSDWKMPRLDGVGLCKKVREDDTDQSYTHFIFVTGNDDKAHFIDGMHAGADDYISKPVDLDELEARLEAAKRMVALQRRLQESNLVLRHDSERERLRARTDALTQARNRLALGEDLEALAARAERYGHKYCAALCDVDHFKAYNDHFGHLPGDEVLRRIARAIRGELRRGDVCYRYGGEEFLVILPEQSLAEATSGMERVRQAIRDLSIPHAPSAKSPYVTISVGISSMRTSPIESIDAWLRRTDGALYLAKEGGRDRVAAEE